MGFVSLFFMTRYLGAENYGIFAWSTAFVAVFAIFSDLGVGYAHLKRVSEGCNLDGCASTFAFLKLLLTLLMVDICLIYIILSYFVFGNEFPGRLLSVVLLLLTYMALSSLSQIARTTFDSKLETSKSQFVAIVDSLSKTSLVILVLLAGMGVVQVALAYAIAGVAVVTVALLLFSRERIVWQKPILLRSYGTFAFPIAIASIAGTLLANSDRLVIGQFWPKADVAYYGSAQSLLLMFGTVGTVLSFISFPVFSKLHKEGRTSIISEHIRQSERYISMISLPIVTLFLLFPRAAAVVFFGKDFAPAGAALGFLSISVFCYQLNQVACAQVIASNQPYVLAKLTWFQLCLNVSLLMIFVPKSVFGIAAMGLSYKGAAIANMTAMVVVFALTRWYIYRAAKIGIYRRLYLHVLAALLVGMALALLTTFVDPDNWYELSSFGIVSYVSFLSILYLFGEFSKQDISRLLDMLSIRKMKEYVWTEFSGKRT